MSRKKSPYVGATLLDLPGQTIWQRFPIGNDDRDLPSNLQEMGTASTIRERGVENNTLPNDLLAFDLAYILNPFL
jgi:hypothetical protein